MVIIGAGNIGRAVALSDSFPANGFQTMALFDNDPNKIGTEIGMHQVQAMSTIADFLANHTVDIAVLAVPASIAQAVVDTLTANGVSAIWNFAPVDLKLPASATAVNVHLEEGLEILSFKMKAKGE